MWALILTKGGSLDTEKTVIHSHRERPKKSPANTLMGAFQPPGLWDNKRRGFEPPGVGYFVMPPTQLPPCGLWAPFPIQTPSTVPAVKNHQINVI